MHILFHHSPAVKSERPGWMVVEGHTLAELEPAPMYEALWKSSPRTVFDLVKDAKSRPVRQWAIFMIRRDRDAVLSSLSLEELFGLLSHEGPEVVALAAEVLRNAPQLEAISVERWLPLLDTANPQALEIICELMTTRLRPERLTLEQVVQVARSRPLPVAHLGFTWLQTKRPETAADCQALLGLVDAEAELLRPEMVKWARGVLSPSPHFQSSWVLEYLDSRHSAVRAEGWRWLQEEARAKNDVELWQRLLESPYDDVRLLLIAELEDRVSRQDQDLADSAKLDAELVRFLWASVLLNIHRGGRIKPYAVGQLVRRITHRPSDAPVLLPIVSVALRSIRGPEWRTGLAGVVRLVEQRPELRPMVQEVFPELKLGSSD
jgi:hypothetical protein